jgi:lipopolysaccharide export system permease protein
MQLYPTTIQRDLLRRFIGPFMFSFSVIVALLIMQFLILFTDRLVGKDLPLLTILELIFSNLASLVVLAIPMSMLAASLLVYGRLSELNEFTALRAAGIHPWQLIKPLLWVSLLVFGIMVYFSNRILPEANLQSKRLWTEIRLIRPAFDVQPGVFYDGIDGYTFLANRIDTQTDSLYGITLYRDQGTYGRAVFRAEKGHIQSELGGSFLKLDLIGGHVTRWIPQSTGNRLMEQSAYQRYSIRFDISTIIPSDSSGNSLQSDRSMSIRELRTQIDSVELQLKTQLQYFSKKENFALQRLIEAPLSPAFTLKPSLFTPNVLPEYYSTNLKASNIVFLQSDSIPPIDRISVLRSTIESLKSSQLDYQNLGQNLQWREQQKAEYRVEILKKFAVPFVCIPFFLCGAFIGLLSKRGNLGFAAITSAVVSTLFWISIIQGEKWADRLFISPAVGMWFGNALLMTLAGILMYRVYTEKEFRFRGKLRST